MALEVANEIMRQLGGAGRLSAMIGTKNVVGADKAPGQRPMLSFRHMAGRDGANFTRVTLDPSDTYTVEVGRIRGHKYTVLHTCSDIYNDALIETVERFTGLALHL